MAWSRTNQLIVAAAERLGAQARFAGAAVFGRNAPPR